MTNLMILGISFLTLVVGSLLGYWTRQSIAKKRKGTIEAKLRKRVEDTKKEAEELIQQAKTTSSKLLQDSQEEADTRRKELIQTERLLYKREHTLDKKLEDFDNKEKDFERKVKKIRRLKEELQQSKERIQKELERVSGIGKKEAKIELLKEVEEDNQKEIIERIQKLNREGEEKYQGRAKEIIIQSIQKYAQSQAHEVTTSTLSLPSNDLKGRIIGKEGRNIKTLEKLTGVEIIVDETPETVIISGFNPVRRQIAKMTLEKLIRDGRIQPAKIEEQVEKSKQELEKQIEEFGKNAVYEAEILNLPDKLVKVLGRLYFRTSYSQNVLLHSIEVSHLAGAIAAEVGANVKICKMGGLLHDIGKAIDQEIEGSHVDIGIRILNKFKMPKEVIDAMKSHHEEYEPESVEALIVQVADQISGARPGARKDTVENYMKRLEELEGIAKDFKGVDKTYAIQAGREIRVFVKPEEIDDLEAYKMAKDIANRIQQDLNYPGEIKVNVIRETRVIEYAR